MLLLRTNIDVDCRTRHQPKRPSDMSRRYILEAQHTSCAPELSSEALVVVPWWSICFWEMVVLYLIDVLLMNSPRISIYGRFVCGFHEVVEGGGSFCMCGARSQVTWSRLLRSEFGKLRVLFIWLATSLLDGEKFLLIFPAQLCQSLDVGRDESWIHTELVCSRDVTSLNLSFPFTQRIRCSLPFDIPAMSLILLTNFPTRGC